MYILLFNFTKVVIKTISIVHPRDIDCILANNPPCIVYEHSTLLSITGVFSKLGLISLNRVNNNRVLFGVMSPIKI